MNCFTCGQAFVPKSKVQHYCSTRCRDNRSRQRDERTCPVCLRPFRPRGYHTKTCSYACGELLRHLGESCAVAYHRCRCGEWYVKRRGAWHCPAPRSPNANQSPSAIRLAERRRKGPTAWTCKTCGAGFFAVSGVAAYCSSACVRGSEAWKQRRRRAKDRRKALKRGAFVEAVERRVVYQRDGWVCQLCRRPVDRTKRAPHPKSPTLDHIIPLAGGGRHEYANAQLAHFICNARKSAGDAQLRWDIAA